jgi:hypothetical protein
MKEDIRQIIEDLHAASRQPLFNGIVGSPDDADTGPLSYHELAGSSFPAVLQRIDRPASKRRCREKNTPSMKTGSWDTVSFVHYFLYMHYDSCTVHIFHLYLF